MTQYRVGPMNLTVENKTWCDNASVSLCQSKKRNNTCVYCKKRKHQIIIHLCNMNVSQRQPK